MMVVGSVNLRERTELRKAHEEKKAFFDALPEVYLDTECFGCCGSELHVAVQNCMVKSFCLGGGFIFYYEPNVLQVGRHNVIQNLDANLRI